MLQKITKELLNERYLAGKSMSEIAAEFGCSQHKVVYWMDKYELKRRTRSEASYLKFNPDGDPFKIKKCTKSSEYILYGIGLGIYWGEGEKVSRNAIRVANTDPFIIKTFISFLLNICQLDIKKLSYSIVCFNDSSPFAVRKYWADFLEISEEKFGKIVQIPPQGKGIYKRKSKYGVCTVSVSNIKLKSWLLAEIRKQYAWIA